MGAWLRAEACFYNMINNALFIQHTEVIRVNVVLFFRFADSVRKSLSNTGLGLETKSLHFREGNFQEPKYYRTVPPAISYSYYPPTKKAIQKHSQKTTFKSALQSR